MIYWLERMLADPVLRSVLALLALLLAATVVRGAPVWWLLGAMVWSVFNNVWGVSERELVSVGAVWAAACMGLALNLLIWPFAACALFVVWLGERLWGQL